MSLSFARIAVGSIWDRNALAELWGYRSFHALARGVFTPAGDNKIVLFVTEQKQESQTPYTDRLEGGQRLFWEGERDIASMSESPVRAVKPKKSTFSSPAAS